MATQLRRGELSGTAQLEQQPYEAEHAAVARHAAAEGIVLLKNADNLLPLPPHSRIALYGSGAGHTVKGGMGSGDVNERYTVSIYDGLKRSGFEITNEHWLCEYETIYQAARQAWRDKLLSDMGEGQKDFFTIYSNNPFHAPAGPHASPCEADAAIMVISRIAGEGADRRAQKGDYYLSDGEESLLDELCRLHRNVIVIINAGGQTDLSFMDSHANIRALLFIAQPGMEGGNAVADVLSGRVTPSGKLTASWAYRYEDYPCAANHARLPRPLEEIYGEGIYVGYRYFDTFGIPLRYGFGYGLSYARFLIRPGECRVTVDGTVSFEVSVRNVSDVYSGREIVQLYVSSPEGRLEKEYRRLCAFAKTKLLAPGEEQKLTLNFTPAELASFDEESAAWVLEAGVYGIYIGDSLEGSELCGSLRLREEKVLTRVKHICTPQRAFAQLHPDSATSHARRIRMEEACLHLPTLEYDLTAVRTRCCDYTEEAPRTDEAARIVARLTLEQLTMLVIGKSTHDEGSMLGSAGTSVPGSAGETSRCAEAEGVPGAVLADGPAGLRLTQFYFVQAGRPLMLPTHACMEHGLFYDFSQHAGLPKRYQFCTAFPVGTLLAQSWDAELLERIGRAVGEEMSIFGIKFWLAPGMNLQRDPLCGRNFEYYSEDPLVSGKCAAAIVRGVQSVHGCAATVKHFACNNREDARADSDSILSERTLRELYLRGFGIAVHEAAPLAIMSSYNRVNGVHAANSHDLCTDVARSEFGFDGFIMTDWWATKRGCTAALGIRAGNDLMMPGHSGDFESIRAALRDGSLTREELERSAARIIRAILR